MSFLVPTVESSLLAHKQSPIHGQQAGTSETMRRYLSVNGLVHGLIPAGKACPFLDKCKFKVHTCPTEEKPKSNHFSCAAARLHSALAESTDVPEFREKYGSIVEKEPEEEPSYNERFDLPKGQVSMQFKLPQPSQSQEPRLIVADDD